MHSESNLSIYDGVLKGGKGIYASDQCTINIHSGEITSNHTAIDASNKCTIIIGDGTISSNEMGISANGPETNVRMEGGTVSGATAVGLSGADMTFGSYHYGPQAKLIGTNIGISVEHGATFTQQNEGTITASEGIGIDISKNGSATFNGELVVNAATGVHMKGSGSDGPAGVEPGCDTPGNDPYWHCTVCDQYFSDEKGHNVISKDSWILPPRHKLIETPEKAATYTEAGNSAYWTCENCGLFFADAEGSTEIEKNSWIIEQLAQEDNPMTAKGKTIKAKAKKTLKFKVSKVMTIKNKQGKLTYKKSKGSKKISISKSTGKLTVKKGLKKGKTYKVRIKVTDAGSAKYKPITKTVTVKVKVK